MRERKSDSFERAAMRLVKPSRKGLSARRLAANRQNAQKSTGPRTKAGKYRSALNLKSRTLVPDALERELRSRGEDPREFCRLHADLEAIFHPTDPATSAAVTMLACAWWQKAQWLRQRVGGGHPHCPEIDARIDALLVLVVDQIQSHHGHWKHRLAAVVGDLIGSPSEVRRDFEAHLALFGGKTRAKAHPPEPRPEADRQALRVYLERLLEEIMAKQASQAEAAKANQTHLDQAMQNQEDGAKSAAPKPIAVIRLLLNELWAKKGLFFAKR